MKNKHLYFKSRCLLITLKNSATAHFCLHFEEALFSFALAVFHL